MYISPGRVVHPYEIPRYCLQCGAAYPWTSARLNAAKTLVLEMDGLTSAEQASLSQGIDDLVRETAQASTAVVRLKKLAPKMGKEALDMLRSILYDIVSETMRKSLWP